METCMVCGKEVNAFDLAVVDLGKHYHNACFDGLTGDGRISRIKHERAVEQIFRKYVAVENVEAALEAAMMTAQDAGLMDDNVGKVLGLLHKYLLVDLEPEHVTHPANLEPAWAIGRSKDDEVALVFLKNDGIGDVILAMIDLNFDTARALSAAILEAIQYTEQDILENPGRFEEEAGNDLPH